MSALKKSKVEAVTTPLEHFNLLHAPAHGTAVLWQRESSGKQWHKLRPDDSHIPALLHAQAGTKDGFLTVNEFKWWRQVDNLKSLRSLYVDIDRFLSFEDVFDALSDAKLPNPSLIVWSGRGVHLYWLHEPMPARVLPVWQKCQDTIVKALASAGADPAAKDCARVLRLCGTLNSKNGALVEGRVLDPVPWSFHDLCDEVLGPRSAPKAKATVLDLATAKAGRGERLRTGSIYDWWHLVYCDLLSIAERHWFGGIPEHHRNTFLFLSSVALSWFAHPETLEAELTHRAQTWTPGLNVAEVKDTLKGPIERARKAAAGEKVLWGGEERDPRYWYKRETLHGLMSPLIDDELAPQLRAIVSDDIRKEHRRETDRAWEEKRPERDRVSEGRRKSHQVGRKADATSAAQAKPWESLGISRATYYRKQKAGAL